MTTVKFGYTILYVEDVVRTLDFYQAAFGMTRQMLHESGDYGELATGDTKLAFASIELMKTLGKTPAKARPETPTFEIALETNDIHPAFTQAVAAGATPVQSPTDMPWGQTIAYLNDNNGFLVELCTPINS